MKKRFALFVTASTAVAMLLTACGGQTTVNNTLPSTEPATSEAPTEASTEPKTLDPNYETLAVDPNMPILALDGNAPFKRITMKTNLNTLISLYGTDYKFTEGANTYQWTIEYGHKIIAVCDADNHNVINSVDYVPSRYDGWRDPRNDFSQVDTNQTYTYAQLYSIIKTPGTVFRLSTDSENRNYYVVCWYDADGTILSAQFRESDNTTVQISIIK